MLSDEFLCFHTRTRLSEASLGIGVSISRLPRTGEIRTVKAANDLLCLRAFGKNKIRKSIGNDSFSHWLPLYFGEFDKYVTKKQVFDEKEEQYIMVEKEVDPKERMVHLLKKSLCFLTTGNTRKPFKASMVLEVMPKLIITHIVDMVDEKKHMSIVAIRRLVNYIRLFRLLIELCPEV